MLVADRTLIVLVYMNVIILCCADITFFVTHVLPQACGGILSGLTNTVGITLYVARINRM